MSKFGLYDIYNKEWAYYCECIYNTPLADLTTDEDWLDDVWHVLVLYSFDTKEKAEEELEWHPWCEVRELSEDVPEIELY